MGTIVSYFWDFGDGETSESQHPYHVYKNPGFYTVSLTVTDSSGVTKTTTKSAYIKIFTTSESLFDYGTGDRKRCLTLGFGSGNGDGWSEFSGDNWLWPETNEAIADISIDEDHLKIIFDYNTGLPFVMNQFQDDVFRDKVGHPDDPDGYPIESTVITPEIIGENRKFRIKHDETFMDIRPIRKGSQYEYPFDVDLSLSIDGSTVAKETIYNLDENREVLFTNKELGNRIQVAAIMGESGYRMTGIETTCVVSDRARYATQEFSNDLDFQQRMASPDMWRTRPGYNIDRATGTTDNTLPFVGIEGPDSYGFSAVELVADWDIDATGYSQFVAWVRTDSGFSLTDTDTGVPIDLVEKVVGSWTVTQADLQTVSNIRISSGSVLYDIRMLNLQIADDDLSSYITDVTLNKGEKYLPGYLE